MTWSSSRRIPGGLDRIEGWRLRLAASGVPEPIAGGLARLQDRLGGDVSDRLEALAGLLDREGQRLADAKR